MDIKKGQRKPQNRLLKLSLKKNRVKVDQETKELNRSSDIMIIDESFDKLVSDFQNTVPSKIFSPIVINDSLNTTNEDDIVTNDEPSKSGNVSVISINDVASPINNENSRPSIGGWSPGQNILFATPRTKPVPTTPKDVLNESLEHCSTSKIQQSHHKLLSELYGETWKSIPSLFKSIRHKHDNINGISKKLHFDDDESDKENIRHLLKQNKELYLTGSDLKNRKGDISNIERKSKKKLYTEKVPSTPDLPKQQPKLNRDAKTTNTPELPKQSIKPNNNVKITSTPKLPKQKPMNFNREVKTTIKKRKDMTVTELVRAMQNDVDNLTKKVQSVHVTQNSDDQVKRLSFIASLADNVPSWRCHPEALQYHDDYKTLKEKLSRRLYVEFNKVVFNDAMDSDMVIIWDAKFRSTAGATRALHKYPELGEISRCHDMEIHFKYCYKCTKCGYSIKRHSKSIDITKKCCGYCRGTFEIILNKKNKDGVVVSTPARKGGPNDFALYVKENYGALKTGRTHGQIMKMLGEQFSAKKNNKQSSVDNLNDLSSD
ncbi:jg16957 [Pararge aegeria aegeria]|uniref:Jg16957 protein n=1 Tax=Pararge aegeria aegeria TaxID=348720 RepID=A0A8S4RJF3_9NEOP|nr:jg16957 [Pararge aegeria aegeria]